MSNSHTANVYIFLYYSTYRFQISELLKYVLLLTGTYSRFCKCQVLVLSDWKLHLSPGAKAGSDMQLSFQSSAQKVPLL